MGKVFEFDAGVFGGELPNYALSGVVAGVLPRLDLVAVCFPIADATVQALLRQNSQLDLRNVEPTAVLRRVVNLQSLRIRPCLFVSFLLGFFLQNRLPNLGITKTTLII